jgi:hypothetical protein
MEAETSLYVKEQAAKGEQLILQVAKEKMELEEQKRAMKESSVTFYRDLVQGRWACLARAMGRLFYVRLVSVQK